MKKKAKTCRDKLKVVTAGQKIAAILRKKAYLKAIARGGSWGAMA
jgi:hypothetical protein